MLPYLLPHLLGCADFGIEFLNDLNFDAEFDFRLEFAGIFDYDTFAVDVDYDGISVSCTRDKEDALGVAFSRKKRCPNRQYQIQLSEIAGCAACAPILLSYQPLCLWMTALT